MGSTACKSRHGPKWIKEVRLLLLSDCQDEREWPTWLPSGFVTERKVSCFLNKAHRGRSKEKSNNHLYPGKEFRVVRLRLIFLVIFQPFVGGPWRYLWFLSIQTCFNADTVGDWQLPRLDLWPHCSLVSISSLPHPAPPCGRNWRSYSGAEHRLGLQRRWRRRRRRGGTWWNFWIQLDFNFEF